VNFADRAIHLMAEADKVILNAFYSAQPAHSYFNGCSQGGHEAMIEAQRYPADFDGITTLAMDGDGYIPADKVHILADAVNEQCDALDGITDGVLNDPRRCKFNPEALRCKGGDTS
jgi:feruloyl esterase